MRNSRSSTDTPQPAQSIRQLALRPSDEEIKKKEMVEILVEP
jgi:hypothetical protein